MTYNFRWHIVFVQDAFTNVLTEEQKRDVNYCFSVLDGYREDFEYYNYWIIRAARPRYINAIIHKAFALEDLAEPLQSIPNKTSIDIKSWFPCAVPPKYKGIDRLWIPPRKTLRYRYGFPQGLSAQQVSSLDRDDKLIVKQS